MYDHSIQRTEKSGNNEFSFLKRTEQLGTATLNIPSYKKISCVQEVVLGKKIVFQEVRKSGIIESCTGLEHIYELQSSDLPQTYIFDNHNHALFFRGRHYINTGDSLPVIHIDQHSDLGQPQIAINSKNSKKLQYIWKYANFVCNVGNFIEPALVSGIISGCKQIRSEVSLLELDKSCIHKKYILDIDLDFRAPEMSIDKFDETIHKTKLLMKNATVITIATSPYFLDQKTALKLLELLVTNTL